MKCKKAVIWWLITKQKHCSLKKKDMTIGAILPLVEKLFPGINFFCRSGFSEVMRDLVIPVLQKRFPVLEFTSEKYITGKEKVKITTFLPSEGYEWQDSNKWRKKFKKKLLKEKEVV